MTGIESRKAVLLARVSTPDQERFGQSLETQVATLREYAKRRGIEIVEEFVFQESAGAGIRQRFERMMRYLKTHRTVKTLLAQNVDRVTRNFRDAVDLDEMRVHNGLEIHFVQENLVINAESSGVDMAVWDVRVFSGRQLLLRMRDQAVSDHRRQARDGKWAFKAPLGYLNVRDEATGRCSIILDGERAPLIRGMFEDYATGLWSICEVAARARKRGLTTQTGKPIPSNAADRMLRNPFYAGHMTVKGTPYIHQYERLVSSSIFGRCQRVLDSRAKQPPKLAGRPFVFRGLLRCAASGRSVSTDAKLRRYKNGGMQEFIYLTPRDPENPSRRLWIREDTVLDQIEAVLQSLRFPRDLMEAFLPAVEAACSEGKALQKHSARVIREQQNDIAGQLDRLTDLALKNLISEEALRQKRATLLSEQNRLNELLVENSRGQTGNNRLKSALQESLNLSSELHRWFASSKIAHKRKILVSVFSNLRLHGGNLEYALNSPFDALRIAAVPGLVAQEELVANLLELETRLSILEIVPKLQELAEEIDGKDDSPEEERELETDGAWDVA